MVRPILKRFLRREILQLKGKRLPLRHISTVQQKGCLLNQQTSQSDFSRGKHHNIQNAVNINFSTSCHRRSNLISVKNGETIIRSPYPDITDNDTPLGEFVMTRLEKHKHLELLVDYTSGRTYTGAQLIDCISRVTSALYKQGYRKGDIILMTSTNSVEVGIVSIAAALIGIIISPSNPAYTAVELARQLDHSGAKAVFTSLANVAVVEEALNTNKDIQENIETIFTLDGIAEGCQPLQNLLEDDGKGFPGNVDFDTNSDIFLLPYSSGTTGLPKGVVLTNKNIVMNLDQTEKGQRKFVSGETVLLGLLPFFHIYGYFVLLSNLAQGCKLIIHPKFEPENFLNSVQKYRITHANIVPPISLFLAKHPMIDQFNLSSLQELITAAAPLGGPISEEMEKRLKVRVLQAYGLTETSPVLTHDEFPNQKHGTVGTLVPSTLAKVKDLDTGKILPAGETGELLFRGPQVMKGYYNNPEATANTIQDGWLYSGDIGRVDEDGYFIISDRLKELIKYKGYQVAPAELEAVLCTHPGIQDAAVIGVQAGEEVGEIPKAFVVVKPGVKITDREVMEFVEKNVAHFKKIRGGVEFIEEIPKNASGKILRRTLKT